MNTATNIPYVKEYHQVDGVVELKNPIKEAYKNDGSNRGNRRIKHERLFNNRNTTPMVVHQGDKGGIRYHKRLQIIDGKQILHYDLVINN